MYVAKWLCVTVLILTVTTEIVVKIELKEFKNATIVLLQKKYVHVILRIKHLVKESQIDIQDVIIALCFNDYDKSTVFCTDNAFETISTVEKLFLCLGKYCTVFDYTVLEIFVQATSCVEAIDELNRFTELLQNRVLQEVDLMSEVGELLNPDDHIQGTYKFVVEYVGGTGTPKAQKMIQSIIQQRASLRRGTLIFKGFSTGSILFIYQVSEVVKHHLLQYKFIEQDLLLFAALYIKKLIIDGIVIMTSHEEVGACVCVCVCVCVYVCVCVCMNTVVTS